MDSVLRIKVTTMSKAVIEKGIADLGEGQTYVKALAQQGVEIDSWSIVDLMDNLISSSIKNSDVEQLPVGSTTVAGLAEQAVVNMLNMTTH